MYVKIIINSIVKRIYFIISCNWKLLNVGILLSVVSDWLLDLGYATGTFIMLLQSAFLGYTYDIYNNNILCSICFPL